jgi:hypothetical protein
MPRPAQRVQRLDRDQRQQASEGRSSDQQDDEDRDEDDLEQVAAPPSEWDPKRHGERRQSRGASGGADPDSGPHIDIIA